MGVVVSRYCRDDAEGCALVFRAAVNALADQDYSANQVQAWLRSAPQTTAEWDTKCANAITFTARDHQLVVGFASLTDQGLIDYLFVTPTHQRQGVASRLLKNVETHANRVGILALTTYASFPAQRFFHAHGYTTNQECHPIRLGVELTNYLMSKQLR